MKNILITPEGIKTNLKNVKPLEAICEYIWNGFDAGASQIKVYLHTNELGLINMVSVIDNGVGIVYHELPYKFQPFNESKKAGKSSRSNHSLPHGRKGIGRLTFFSFAQMARWETVYEKDGKRYQYYIDMNKDSLNEYDDNGGNSLIKKEVYPEFDKNNFMDMYRKKELDNLVETLYTAQPKIFTGLNDENKKIMIHLLQLIMDNSNKPELFEVLQQVIDLDEDEIKELAEVLKYTTLNNITKVIKLLQDRIKVIQGLKEIVFDDKQFAKEVEHIQEVVEKHYWLFGEQYSLITAAEPDFEQALKGLLIATKGDDSKVIIDHEDKNKEMDIYMIRQDRRGNVTENVVVELKRPTVPLGEEQLSQVKKYMRVIKSDDRFNASNVKWTYFLVGNRYNKNGYIQDEIDGHRALGEPHLVHADRNGNNKIYVLTWSDIFDEFSLRHDYLMCKLELEKEIWLKKHDSIENVVEDIKENSATLDSSLIPKRAQN